MGVINNKSGATGTNIQKTVFSLIQRAYIERFNGQVNVPVSSGLFVKQIESHPCANPHLPGIHLLDGSNRTYPRI